MSNKDKEHLLRFLGAMGCLVLTSVLAMSEDISLLIRIPVIIILYLAGAIIAGLD